MAIALDTTAYARLSGGQSVSFTCTGSNLILFAFATDISQSSMSMTYNGVSMTQLTSIRDDNSNYNYCFYLLNPATGAHNLVPTMGGGATGQFVIGSYTGVNQAAPDSSNTGNNFNTAANLTVSTTVVASNCWLVGGFFGKSSGNPMSLATNRTDRQYDSFPNTTQGGTILSDSNGTIGTGSQSTSFSESGGSIFWFRIGMLVSIAPSLPTSDGNMFFMM